MNAAEECYARLLAAQAGRVEAKRANPHAFAEKEADDSKERQRLALNAKIRRRLPKSV